LPNVEKIKELRYSLQLSLAPYPAVRLLALVVLGILAGVNLPLPVEGWLLFCLFALLVLLAGLLYERVRNKAPYPLFFTSIGYLLFLFFSFAASSDYRLHYAARDGLLRFVGKNVAVWADC